MIVFRFTQRKGKPMEGRIMEVTTTESLNLVVMSRTMENKRVVIVEVMKRLKVVRGRMN